MRNYPTNRRPRRYGARFKVVPLSPLHKAELYADHYITRYVINNTLPDSWANARWRNLDTDSVLTTCELAAQLILTTNHNPKCIVSQFALEYRSLMLGIAPPRKRPIWDSFRVELLLDI